jgi:hypothetical protein
MSLSWSFFGMIITSSVMNLAECWVQSSNKNIKWHPGAHWSVFKFTLNQSSYIQVYCYFSRKCSHRLNLRTKLCPLNMITSRIYAYPLHIQDFSGPIHGLAIFGAFLPSGKFCDSALKQRWSNPFHCTVHLLIRNYIYLSLYLSMALQPLWTFSAFSVY